MHSSSNIPFCPTENQKTHLPSINNFYYKAFFRSSVMILIILSQFQIHLSIVLSIYPFIHLSICPSVHLSICPYVHTYVICLVFCDTFICLSNNLSIYVSIHPSIFLSIYLYIYRSTLLRSLATSCGDC